MAKLDYYVIYGVVKKNGVLQASENVTIRNDTRSEEHTVQTDADGKYSITLTRTDWFPSGCYDGDIIKVTSLNVTSQITIDIAIYPDKQKVDINFTEIKFSMASHVMNLRASFMKISFGVKGSIFKILSILSSLKMRIYNHLSSIYFLKIFIQSFISIINNVMLSIESILVILSSLMKRIYGSVNIVFYIKSWRIISKSISFGLRKFISKSLSILFNLRQYISKLLGIRYNVRTTIYKTIDTKYSMRAIISKLVSLTYAITGFYIIEVTVNPSKIHRLETESTTLRCDWHDEHDLEDTGYACKFWVRDKNNTEYGPYNGVVTKEGIKEYHAEYSLDPDATYLLGKYDVKAEVTKYA